MRLAFVELSGFRGYTHPLRIEFADGFTIIDGRNGVGKSTISDAVEFALTGTITKYRGASSDRETVEDYLWWRGSSESLDHPAQHYVDVGFSTGTSVVSVRRERVGGSNSAAVSQIAKLLADETIAPKDALAQLCSASIIRDEHIADLSLDLKDTERYSLLRNAIGATDADLWIERARQLQSRMKAKVEIAERDAVAVSKSVAQAEVQLDQLRATQPAEAALLAANERLQAFIGRPVALDEIIDAARGALADSIQRLDGLKQLERDKARIDRAIAEMETQDEELSQIASNSAALQLEIDRLEQLMLRVESSSSMAQRARDLAALALIGHRVGIGDHGSCPLCAAARTSEEFARGLALAEQLANELDGQAAEQERQEQELANRKEKLAASKVLERNLRTNYDSNVANVAEFNRLRAELSISDDQAFTRLPSVIESLEEQIARVRDDLRIALTVEVGPAMLRSQAGLDSSRQRHAQAEARLGIARRGERQAQALLDAARRAASEALDARLDRVLPLMAELYRRLRPHPIWDNIEYRIRGDVRKFLRLQVGEELNPQFMFSSGQRRAAGLAFLLSVNMSLAWSKWKTIMLDDPVQHIDDFRSVHLAEVLAQLVSAGRQVICSVEDPALAEFLSRRLPVSELGWGKRISLGPNELGILTRLEERTLAPMPKSSLVAA